MLRIGGRGWTRAGMVAVVLAVAGAAQAGKTPDPLRLWVKAAITIAPDGRITSLAWDEKRDAVKRIATLLEPRVRALEFEPGQIDGVPVETETTLSLTLLLSETADRGMDVAIADAHTGTIAIDMPPPMYPKAALYGHKEAEVTLDVEIAADGRLSLLGTDYRGGAKGDRKLFEQASIEAASRWTYRVERVGGHAVAARMSIPVSFCLEPSSRPWCKSGDSVRKTADGRMVPAGEAVALDSVVRLKTDLAGI